MDTATLVTLGVVDTLVPIYKVKHSRTDRRNT